MLKQTKLKAKPVGQVIESIPCSGYLEAPDGSRYWAQVAYHQTVVSCNRELDVGTDIYAEQPSITNELPDAELVTALRTFLRQRKWIDNTMGAFSYRDIEALEAALANYDELSQ